jgi:HNH endonuclease
MDAALTRLVWQRAKNRCEYCRMSQAADDASFEIDHIIARKHGGQSVASNLCMSCVYYHVFKWSDISSLERNTRKCERNRDAASFSAQATAGIERVIKPLHGLKTSESLRSQSPHSFGRRERYLWKHRCATETVTTSTSSSRSCRR